MRITKPERVGMAPNEEFTHPIGSKVDTLKQKLEQIRSFKITVGGKPFHAVSSESLSLLEAQVDKELAHVGETGDGSPTELISMHDELVQLRAEQKRTKAELDKLSASEADSRKALSASRAAWKVANDKLADVRSKSESEVKDAKTKLAGLEAELTKLKVAGKQPTAKFDPEAAALIDRARDEASQQVKAIQKKLEANNNLKSAAQAEVNKLHKEVKARELELESEKAKVTEMKVAIEQAENKGKPLVISKAMRALLGESASHTLESWSSTASEDVKERAYIGMKALTRHKNKLLSAIGRLFEKVFQWCKTQGIRARKALKPWMDMVIEDIASAKLRAISFYRDELKKLQVIIEEKKQQRKEKAEKAGAIPPNDEGLFSEIWFYGYAILLRIRRTVVPVPVKIWRYSRGTVNVAYTTVRFTVKTVFRPWKFILKRMTFEEYVQEFKDDTKDFVPSLKRAFWRPWGLGHEPVTPEDVIDIDPAVAPVAADL